MGGFDDAGGKCRGFGIARGSETPSTGALPWSRELIAGGLPVSDIVGRGLLALGVKFSICVSFAFDWALPRQVLPHGRGMTEGLPKVFSARFP